LARLVPEKNIEEILHAAKLLQRFIDFRLKIGGDGPELVNLKRISNRLGVKAEFTGRVTDPVSFHQSLDVFILASNREGLSISLQEAMSCGTVPVTVKGNGCIELVRDGYNGFLYESGNLNMLVDKIIEAVEDRDMFQRARKTIVKKFDNKITSKRYLQLYSDLGIFFKR
jgi:L-malate glycosyltransferase